MRQSRLQTKKKTLKPTRRSKRTVTPSSRLKEEMPESSPPLAQEIDLSDVEDDQQHSMNPLFALAASIKEEIDDDDADDDEIDVIPAEEVDLAWIATSRKRKESFHHANAHLQSLATEGGFPSPPLATSLPVMPPAPKRSRIVPGCTSRMAVTGRSLAPAFDAVSAPSVPKNTVSRDSKIDWTERKAQLSDFSNAAFVDPLLSALLDIFHDVARESRSGDLSKTGPTFLWRLVDSFVEAIEKSPWGYWEYNRTVDEEDEEEIDDGDRIVFVQFPYGSVASNLTAGQKKFRLSCMGKIASLFEAQARTFMSDPSIKVIWTKKFGENVSFTFTTID